jgi:hypothetical protein
MTEHEARAREIVEKVFAEYHRPHEALIEPIASALQEQAETIERLREALKGLVRVIDAGDPANLMHGVQLGPTVWYLAANDALDYARAALESSNG